MYNDYTQTDDGACRIDTAPCKELGLTGAGRLVGSTMPSVQSLYFFGTLLGGVFVPLIFFVAVKKAVDCTFAYLEALGIWEGTAGGSEVRPPQAARDMQHSNVLVDGFILTGTQTGLVGAVNGCTDPREPAAVLVEPAKTGLHTCVAKREPLRDAPHRGANHLGVVAFEGDTFEVLDTATDSGGVDRMFVRLESSGKTGWVRSSTAISCAEVAMRATTQSAPVQGAVARFTATASTIVPPARRIPGSPGESQDDLRSDADSAAVAVEQWLVGRGLAQRDIVSGACAALDGAGVPSREWQSELEALEMDGSLQHWLGLIKAHGARTAASSSDGAAASAAEDV